MNELTSRFFEVYEALKKIGKIKSYIQLGEVIGTNKAGVSDIKNGRKKLSIDHLIGMKNSYPEINLEWIFCSEGDMWKEKSDNNRMNSKDQYIIDLQRDKINFLEKEIDRIKKANEPTSGYRNVAEPNP